MFAIGSGFGVTQNGTLYSNNANIKGNITATSGTIGGCSIVNGTLTIGSANISSLSVDKITGGKNTAAITMTNINATGGSIGG